MPGLPTFTGFNISQIAEFPKIIVKIQDITGLAIEGVNVTYDYTEFLEVQSGVTDEFGIASIINNEDANLADVTITHPEYQTYRHKIMSALESSKDYETTLYGTNVVVTRREDGFPMVNEKPHDPLNKYYN